MAASEGGREARAATDEVNDRPADLGLDGRALRAVPHVAAQGDRVVWLLPEGARVITCALAELRAAG
ncbi:hypothetical protein ACIQKE_12800 [Streptomyces griseoviridis]